jgi:hypothetical protein
MACNVVPKAAQAAKAQPFAHSAATTSLLVLKVVASVKGLFPGVPALHVLPINITPWIKVAGNAARR